MYYCPPVVRNHRPASPSSPSWASRRVFALRTVVRPSRCAAAPSPRPPVRVERFRARFNRFRPPVGASRCRAAPEGSKVWRAPLSKANVLRVRSTDALLFESRMCISLRAESIGWHAAVEEARCRERKRSTSRGSTCQEGGGCRIRFVGRAGPGARSGDGVRRRRCARFHQLPR